MKNIFDQDIVASASVPGSYNANCPFCEHKIGKVDTKKHLNFNTRKGVYRCPRCDTSGKLSDLSEFNLLVDSKAPELPDLKQRMAELFIRKRNVHFDLDLISWPLTPEQTPIAYNYIKVRGFTDDDIQRYGLRVGIPYFDPVRNYQVKKWTGRILFPFLNETGECTYLVGRTYVGGEPRYLNSGGSRSALVYNLQEVQGECIVCEGIVSAIKAEKITGIPSVALLGKSATNFQLSRIRSRATRVWLALDGDTLPQEKDLIIQRLFALGCQVYIIDLPLQITPTGGKKKDPDDWSKIFLRLFESARRVDFSLAFSKESRDN